MKYGQRVEREKKQMFEVGVDGVSQPSVVFMDEQQEEQRREQVKRVISEKLEKRSKGKSVRKEEKIYLNTPSRIIKILSLRSWLKKWLTSLHSHLIKWYRKKSIEELLDTGKFIFLHGLIATPILITLLTLTNADISIVRIVKSSWVLAALTYLLGTGGGYYLLLDGTKALRDIMRSQK